MDKPRKRVDEHCVLVLLGLDGKTGTQTTEGGYQATGNYSPKRRYRAWCNSAEDFPVYSLSVTKQNGVPDPAAAGWEQDCADVATRLAKMLSSHLDIAAYKASETALCPDTPPGKRLRASPTHAKEHDTARERKRLLPKLAWLDSEVENQAVDEYLTGIGDVPIRIQSKTAQIFHRDG